MKNKVCLFRFLSLVLVFILTTNLLAQEEVFIPDLKKINNTENWEIFNREASLNNIEGNINVHFKEAQGSGLAWINDHEFANCIIEFDVKGRNIRGRSFVGIAFRGIDNETYDGIYFRPFNFKSENDLNRSHGVQYIDHPDNTWSKLRAEHTGIYENEVKPVPNPEKFFHAKIVIMNKDVSVYVNNADEPCLVVKTLNDRKKGKIGLWMGNGSDGYFSNLKIIKN